MQVSDAIDRLGVSHRQRPREARPISCPKCSRSERPRSRSMRARPRRGAGLRRPRYPVASPRGYNPGGTAPGVPELGKPVQQDDERPGSGLHVMQAHAVDVGEMVLPGGVILRRDPGRRCRVEHDVNAWHRGCRVRNRRANCRGLPLCPTASRAPFHDAWRDAASGHATSAQRGPTRRLAELDTSQTESARQHRTRDARMTRASDLRLRARSVARTTPRLLRPSLRPRTRLEP
jgi:hypothetical protein